MPKLPSVHWYSKWTGLIFNIIFCEGAENAHPQVRAQSCSTSGGLHGTAVVEHGCSWTSISITTSMSKSSLFVVICLVNRMVFLSPVTASCKELQLSVGEAYRITALLLQRWIILTHKRQTDEKR